MAGKGEIRTPHQVAARKRHDQGIAPDAVKHQISDPSYPSSHKCDVTSAVLGGDLGGGGGNKRLVLAFGSEEVGEEGEDEDEDEADDQACAVERGVV